MTDRQREPVITIEVHVIFVRDDHRCWRCGRMMPAGEQVAVVELDGKDCRHQHPNRCPRPWTPEVIEGDATTSGQMPLDLAALEVVR